MLLGGSGTEEDQEPGRTPDPASVCVCVCGVKRLTQSRWIRGNNQWSIRICSHVHEKHNVFRKTEAPPPFVACSLFPVPSGLMILLLPVLLPVHQCFIHSFVTTRRLHERRNTNKVLLIG